MTWPWHRKLSTTPIYTLVIVSNALREINMYFPYNFSLVRGVQLTLWSLTVCPARQWLPSCLIIISPFFVVFHLKDSRYSYLVGLCTRLQIRKSCPCKHGSISPPGDLVGKYLHSTVLCKALHHGSVQDNLSAVSHFSVLDTNWNICPTCLSMRMHSLQPHLSWFQWDVVFCWCATFEGHHRLISPSVACNWNGRQATTALMTGWSFHRQSAGHDESILLAAPNESIHY